ncbi:O-glucosyltransferase rumi homolog [Phalaenopsis equestris]|uniref:O-glucosyltransferase rumi homolog n=1 Tax=Phalaenopsis equestris TaxID=78828 RepID=UPI0009E34571|nr:O-glucosyltransferase rumi homolog [Phalaenopsis equestris]
MEILSHENLSSRAKIYFNAISNSAKTVVFIFILLFLAAFSSSRWIGKHSFPSISANTGLKFPWITTQPSSQPSPLPKAQPNRKPSSQSLTCSSKSPSNSCPTHPSQSHNNSLSPTPPPIPPPFPQPNCPDYFRWIHEDLRPWSATGISREMLDLAAPLAAFRLIIVDGHPYIHHYHPVFQTRDLFTIWGILQLLRRYPGQIPDLDLMFNCEDMPVVHAPNGGRSPPPLFRYCKDDTTLDIVFPDWSFWGWPEVNIRPWNTLAEELNEANERLPWREREPYAYWKGNPDVAGTRGDLMKCNVTDKKDWEARLFRVNWVKEGRRRFKHSNLADQCSYRYKVYIEGRAWSVSEKYILGCDSPTLYVQSRFQDFVSRGLRPGLHYWPIPQNDKCRAIKQAVEWGNSHPAEIQAMGKRGSSFIHESLHMNYVYDYMLHLLTEYSKLLTFKPTKPEDAMDLCLESEACPSHGKVREFLMESMAAEPISNDSEPCNLPSGFQPSELKQLLMEKTTDGTKMVVESMIRRSHGGKRLSGSGFGIRGEVLGLLLVGTWSSVGGLLVFHLWGPS